MTDLTPRSHDAPLGEILGVLPLVSATAFIAGWFANRHVPLTTNVAAAGAATTAVCLVLIVWYALRARRQERLTAMTGVLLICSTVATVMFGVIIREELRAIAFDRYDTTRGSGTHVVGNVVTEPRPVAGRWLTVLRTRQIDGVSVVNRVAVLHTGDPPALGYGMSFRAPARQLGTSGFHAWLKQQHVTAMFEPAIVMFEPGQQRFLTRASEHVRARVRDAAARNLSQPAAGLMVALVTGDRRGIEPGDAEAMRTVGMSHLTAISGMHLAVFAGGVLFVLSLIGCSPTFRRVGIATALVWFAFVTRFQPSVLRAGVMALLMVYGMARGRVNDARYALCVAVLLLLSVDPRLAGSVGLQLSAVATSGVLLLTPVLQRQLPARLPRRVRDAVAVTSGAQLAVMPLLIATFGSVSLVAFPANVIAGTFAMAAALIGFVGTAVSLIHPVLGGVVFYLAAPFVGVVLATARSFAAVPFALSWGALWLIAITLVGSVMIRSIWRSSYGRRALVLLVTVGVLAASFVTLRMPEQPEQLTLTAIDVGQGDAWLVEYQNVRILVDAGTDDTAARWLRRTGRRSIDLLVLTHPHQDHIGGAVSVLERITVGRVWMMTYGDDGDEAHRVRRRAAALDVALHAPPVFHSVMLGPLRIEVLNPPNGRVYRGTGSEWNNESIALRMVTPTGTLLLLGDTEAPAHRRMLDSSMDLRADVIAVPHHGSATTDQRLFAAVGAHTAVISAGHDNPYGHPHREVLAALASQQMKVLRTDLSGTVRVTVTRATDPSDRWETDRQGVPYERRDRRSFRCVRRRTYQSRRPASHHPWPRQYRGNAGSRHPSGRASRREPSPREHCRV